MKWFFGVFALFLISACGGGGSGSQAPDSITPPDPQPEPISLYFPPVPASATWLTTSPTSLGWNTSAIEDLTSFLEANGTRAFIVLHNGNIVVEEYFGRTINGENDFDQSRNWYWASAGKTLTSFMVGVAQTEGYLSLSDPSSDYLGPNWSSLTPEREQSISIFNQLTMTTGLDDSVPDDDCTLSGCLVYLAEPNTRWAYHNAPYTLLTQVVANATEQEFNQYFNQKLRDRVGMDGFWFSADDSYNEVYYSTARSMARFGLLMLNQGVWEDEVILDDMSYIDDMTQTSQTLNPAYGYLWWLNGKASFMVPATGEAVFNGPITPDAPADMFAAIGKNGQIINIVPSENLVVVRMGESSDEARVAIQIQNQMWSFLSRVID